MYNKRMKKKLKNIVFYIMIGLCICALAYSLYQIYFWLIDTNDTQSIIDDIYDLIDKPVNTIEETSSISQNEDIKVTNDAKKKYMQYVNMNMLDVDLNKLKEVNGDTVGWLYLVGTNINYPYVKKDNNFYLNHSYDKSYNNAGWIFLDERNNTQSFDKNTIIYGHGRAGTLVFGNLRSIKTSGWYNSKNNHYVKLETENESTIWEVFSVYKINNTSDYIRTTFYNDADFEQWASMIKNRSDLTFETNVTKDDKVLTLSTCYNESSKVVLHARLAKSTSKN